MALTGARQNTSHGLYTRGEELRRGRPEDCRELPAKGKLVSDAWHAALAIEYDCEWISTDGDFARFNSLRWRHPLK